MRVLAALLLAVPCGAVAQPGPRATPIRDVVVVYRVEGPAAGLVPGGLPGPVRLSWDAAGQRVRAEAEGRSQVALVDLRAHSGQAIDTALRVVLPLPVRAQDLQPLTLEGARLVPRGKEVVAGLACTLYRVETAHAPGSACLTADGVPLRGEGEVQGRSGRFTAISVSYGPLPPGLFTVPAGYVMLGGPGGGVDMRQLGGLLERLGR